MNDEIKAVLTSAVSIVDEANIPSDLRETAFAKAVDMLVGNSRPGTRGTSPELTAHRSESSAPWMQELTTATGRSPVELEELFFPGDDELPLVGVDITRLGKGAAQRSRKVALLIAGVRQVTGIEQGTASGTIREECDRLGVFDSGNFGKTINGLRDCFNITGSGRTKVLRIKPGGRDAFRDLIGELLGDGHS